MLGVAVSRSGYTAWETVNNDAAGCDQPGIDAIHVHDGAGTRTVDTEMVPEARRDRVAD